MAVKRKKRGELREPDMRRLEKRIDRLERSLKEQEMGAIVKKIGKLQKDINSMQDIVVNFFRGVKECQDDIERINKWRKGVSEKVDRIDLERLLETFYHEVDNIKGSFKDNTARLNEEMERILLETSRLVGKIEDVDRKYEMFKGLDVDSLRRDIEALKVKSQWLDERIKEINTDAIHQRISDLHHRVKSFRDSSPLILE